MRTPISTQRAILHFDTKGSLSCRAIARQLLISHKTVATVRQKFKSCGLTYEQLVCLDDETFSRKLGSKANQRKSTFLLPDYSKVQEQLQLRDMTLGLLWMEYRASCAGEALEQCVSYSQFCRQYKKWIKSQRISMRQFHKPGEKMFVDFCGRTMPITDFETGEVTNVQVFVAVLGASGYVFAIAVDSQKISDWLLCHVKAFEYFGGVPKQVVPDNLKSAVIKHTQQELIINKAYLDLADHYDLIVNPARARKPKDKSLAEVNVQIVQRWGLAPLRNKKFFSLQELNEELLKRIDSLNKKISKKYSMSRLDRFNALEKAYLHQLPAEPYEVADWKYNVRIPDDYHIYLDKHYYSVPFQHRGQLVDLRITRNAIEILLGRKRIACHSISLSIGKTTNAEHMPIEHLRHAEGDPEELLLWAKDIGSNVYEWVRQNLQHRRDYANAVKSVVKLRSWARTEQNYHRLDSACEFALSISELTFQRLQLIVRSNSDIRPKIEVTSWVQSHENVRGADYYSTERYVC